MSDPMKAAIKYMAEGAALIDNLRAELAAVKAERLKLARFFNWLDNGGTLESTDVFDITHRILAEAEGWSDDIDESSDAVTGAGDQ